jgi:hypothetical protein
VIHCLLVCFAGVFVDLYHSSSCLAFACFWRGLTFGCLDRELAFGASVERIPRIYFAANYLHTASLLKKIAGGLHFVLRVAGLARRRYTIWTCQHIRDGQLDGTPIAFGEGSWTTTDG